jgi:hypothetical protein
MNSSFLKSLLPYCVGSSLAMLTLGLVIAPVWSQQGGSQCYYCTNFYYSNCMDGTFPECNSIDASTNYGKYKRMQKANELVRLNCHVKQPDGSTKPCPSTTSKSYEGLNCESESCAILVCNEFGVYPFRPGSTCTAQCNNCDQSYNNCNMLRNEEALDHLKKHGFPMASNCFGYCGCGNP